MSTVRQEFFVGDATLAKLAILAVAGVEGVRDVEGIVVSPEGGPTPRSIWIGISATGDADAVPLTERCAHAVRASISGYCGLALGEVLVEVLHSSYGRTGTSTGTSVPG